jgi:DNA-binding HxlR family transcriptional regulator
VVLRRTYENQNCSIARSLETIGERWTLLILRDAFLGTRRFDDFQKSLGVARNVLTVRLKSLVDAGLLERRRYQERPDRYEYRLTEKGIDLYPTLVALMAWGDRYLNEDDAAPLELEHRDCGSPVHLALVCDAGHELSGAREVRPVPRPAAAAG